MWGMIATWRMAVEGITKGAEMLKDGGDAGDAVESAIREGNASLTWGISPALSLFTHSSLT